MMLYEYKCKTCERVYTLELTEGEYALWGIPVSLVCRPAPRGAPKGVPLKCDGTMRRLYSPPNIGPGTSGGTPPR